MFCRIHFAEAIAVLAIKFEDFSTCNQDVNNSKIFYIFLKIAIFLTLCYTMYMCDVETISFVYCHDYFHVE